MNKYQAQIKFKLSPDGPILVSSGSRNKMRPELPDNTFLMGWDGEQFAYVIPGSSLKGVMRHYLYVATRNDNRVDNLFGKLALKSKISVSDAYADMATIKTSIRHSTSINSVSQSAKNGTLNNMQVIIDGIFEENVRLNDVDKEEIALAIKAIDAIENGEIHIGGKISRGFGRMHVSDFNITVACGYDENLQPVIVNKYDSLRSAEDNYIYNIPHSGGGM